MVHIYIYIQRAAASSIEQISLRISDKISTGSPNRGRGFFRELLVGLASIVAHGHYLK